MKISLDWVGDHIALPDDLDPARVAAELTLKTVEVEHISRVDGDVVLDIDNKSLTNRPDLWGHFGMARELGAIFGIPLAPLAAADPLPCVEGLVHLDDAARCLGFTAVSFDLPHPVETPEWMAARLRRVGEFVGLFLVDLSNYVMLETGQPTHVYDRDLLRLPLTVAPGDESDFEVLSGARLDVRGMSTIRDVDGAVGLAGVMGGRASAVRSDTVHGLLEVAAFPAMDVRRASQRVGIRSEASSRYEKALDTQRVAQAADLFLALLEREVPGVVVLGRQDVVLAATEPTEVVTTRTFLETRIGEALPDAEMRDTLSRLGFEITIDEVALRTVSPTWRSTGDIGLPHDILEELARIHGYDQLPATSVTVALRDVRSLHRIPLDRLVRESMAFHAVLHEVVTYPWTTDAGLVACGYDKTRTVRFQGAPSPDRSSLRPALLPNLLDVVASNLRQYPAFGLFEVGTVFDGSDPLNRTADGVVEGQVTELGVVLVEQDGAALFRRLRGLVDALRQHARVVSLELGGDTEASWADEGARVALVADGVCVGEMALVRPRTLRAAGITGVQVGHLRLDLRGLRVHDSRANHYVPVPELPDTRFDLSLVIDESCPWATIEQTVLGSRSDVIALEYLGDFRGGWVPTGQKSLSLRITLSPREQTFTSTEISAARADVIDALAQGVGATLRTT